MGRAKCEPVITVQRASLLSSRSTLGNARPSPRMPRISRDSGFALLCALRGQSRMNARQPGRCGSITKMPIVVTAIFVRIW
jgi:hypothetical protein